jgi:cysteine-S-conjugate beta-lyase
VQTAYGADPEAGRGERLPGAHADDVEIGQHRAGWSKHRNTESPQAEDVDMVGVLVSQQDRIRAKQGLRLAPNTRVDDEHPPVLLEPDTRMRPSGQPHTPTLRHRPGRRGAVDCRDGRGTLTDAGDCRMASMSRGPNPLEQVSLGELRRRTSLKWRTYPEDVLPMWVAEMDVMLAEPIARSLIDAIELGDTGYAAGTAYAEALQGFALDRWGWDGIVVERTAIVPDVMMGVVEVLRLVTEPGDAVVVNCPVYPPFYSFVEHMDRRIVEAPLTPEHRLDLDALGEAFARATAARNPAAYLLCNPHNPTGTVHSIDELGAVAALAATHHVRVVADEIHAPVIMPGQRFVPYLSVPGSENAFSLMSASKAWNLAGLKAALAIAGPHATDDLARLPEEVSHGPSHLGLIAHTAALADGGAWLDALLAGLDHNRHLLTALIEEHLPQVRYTPPQATFLAWLDCRALRLDDGASAVVKRGLVTLSAGPAAVFLDKGRAALSAGPAFGTGGAGHVRLNRGTSTQILTEAVHRMAAAIT